MPQILSKDDQAFPGDVIAMAEEYVPGKNTLDLNGEIISSVFGKVFRDERELDITVRPFKEKINIKSGDIAYGKVIKVDQRKAVLRIGAIYNREHGLRNYDIEASLGLGGRSSRGPPLILMIGDIVRVRILKTGRRGIELGIFGNNLGVLRTFCIRCREIMKLKDDVLYCENCERTENKKVAPDYGMIKVDEE